MSTPFDAPQFDGPSVQEDPWIRYTQITLVVVGAGYALLGVALTLGMPVLVMLDPSTDPEVAGASAAIMGVCMALTMAAITIPNFVAAWGLGRRAKWAWVLAVILGGLYAPSACLPFGGVILYGMLNDRTRKTFLG